MYKNGQVFFFTFMLGLTVLILALAFAPAMRESVDNTRATTVGDTIGMNCSTTTSTVNKITCTFVDISLFYFIGGLIFIAGSIITAKLIIR